jgi:formylglycine-generating enzyme required for sulfatase activity
MPVFSRIALTLMLSGLCSFYLGRYPVTNEDYAQFLQANPFEKEPEYWADRRLNQARQPVVGISWDAARRFAQWAGGRLPTEAEWEYAARAGTSSLYFWGAAEQAADDYAWHSGNAQGATHPVGEKRPNPFGLHDMAGNVWEWVQDRWHDNYSGAPGDGCAWKNADGSRRVVRGGCWNNGTTHLRPAYHIWINTSIRNYSLGFRLAQDITA